MKSLLPPIFFSITALAVVFGTIASVPVQQDSGVQAAIWTAAVVTTTAKTSTVACGQGTGSIGRKTLSVHNAGSGAVTVTVELRTSQNPPDVTSGYLAVNGLASGGATSATTSTTSAGGAFCYVSAVSASTSIITATLRRE